MIGDILDLGGDAGLVTSVLTPSYLSTHSDDDDDTGVGVTGVGNAGLKLFSLFSFS